MTNTPPMGSSEESSMGCSPQNLPHKRSNKTRSNRLPWPLTGDPDIKSSTQESARPTGRKGMVSHERFDREQIERHERALYGRVITTATAVPGNSPADDAP